MTISNTMLRNYLELITLTYFVDHNEMPEDLSEFDSYIDTVRRNAEASADLPWLLRGLQYLLNAPDVNLEDYGGGVFPLHAEDVRSIIWRVLDYLQAPGGTAMPVVPITLPDMTGDEWRAYKASLATA